MAYHIIGYQTNPITGETIFNILCDTAADLPISPVSDNGYGGEIGQGSKAVVIADGTSYIADSSRNWIYQPNPNAWVNVYTKSEIDNMITEVYQTIIYYHTTQTSIDGAITFYALEGVVKSLSIYGNGSQSGTPTPDNPVMPTFCGTLGGTDWTIPITNAGQTVPVYLGQTPTVRRIKKLVLTGDEGWERQLGQTVDYFRLSNMPASPSKVICTHYQSPDENIAYSTIATGIKMQQSTSYGVILACRPSPMPELADFKSYLASEYAAGHPVTVWYVLATPETATVNEPLAKIGDYADELHITDGEVTIPTINGSNVLTVDTDLPPSLIEISGGN